MTFKPTSMPFHGRPAWNGYIPTSRYGAGAAGAIGRTPDLPVGPLSATQRSRTVSPSAACAAARRAIGTRYGEQET